MVLKRYKVVLIIGLVFLLPIAIKTFDNQMAEHVATEPVMTDSVAVDSNTSQDFEQLRSERMTAIFQRVQEQVLKAESDFSDLLKMKLQEMGSYSSQEAAGFNEFLLSAVRSFNGSMHVVEQNANSDYYFFLEQHGMQTDDPRNVSPDERILFQGVHRVTQLAITYVRALVLDLTSKHVKDHISFQVGQAFEELEVQAQRDYDWQRAENEKGLDRSWWQSVKESGLDLLGDFSNEFNIQVKQEVQRQVGQAIDQAAGAVLGAVAQGAIGLLKPLVGGAAVQLAELSKVLSQNNPLELMRDHANIALAVLKMTIRFGNPVNKPKNIISVQTYTGLGEDELVFVKNRRLKIQKTLKSEFGITQPLSVSWCFSGGGIRAALMTEGMLAAAARHKILDVSMYLVGLSGSTWLIAPWSYLYLKGYLAKDLETSIGQVLKNLEGSLQDPSMVVVPKTNAYGPPLLSADIAPSFSKDIAIRFAFNQTITIVDVYGALIGNFALKQAGAKRLNMTWSSVCQEAKRGLVPWPLCSSVFDPLQNKPLKNKQNSEYEWFEMGPSQAGSSALGYIPIQYLGSNFKDGKLVVDVMSPEYSLAFYLGVYGSAFAAISPNLVIDKTLPDIGFTIQGVDVKIPVSKWVRNVIDESFGSSARSARSGVIHAQFPNYSAGILSSLLQNERTIGLIDGATDFNFPLPLLFERSERLPDIVFLCDSADVDYPDLKGAAAYFKRKGITAVPDLTSVSKADLQASTMTVFNDPRNAAAYNSKQATIIYFPTRGIDQSVGSPYFTLNFKYTPEEIKVLVDNVSSAFESQVPEIKNIMKLVGQLRHGGTMQDAPEKTNYFKKLGNGLKSRLPILGN